MVFIIILIIILIIVFIKLLRWYIDTANSLKQKPIEIEQALSNIDVSLAKRADTLKKQLDVTKGYAKHEFDTLTAVVNLRKGMTVKEMQEENAKMDEIQSRINAVAESYPELRSSENFIQLQKAINTCEADLSATRRLYNANVAEFNKMIVTFPTTIVANKLGCQKFVSFEATQTQRQDVEMSF
ncbi:MAG: LemA family protein [Eubacterium sp.]